MAKTTRRVFHSLHTTRDGWKVTKDNRTVSMHATQKEAEDAVIAAGRKAFEDGGLGQAILHKVDGSIGEERTYGKDPEKTEG